MTRKQQATLEAIREYIAQNGLPPTQKELQDVLHVSQPSIRSRLNGLVKAGVITVEFHKARGIRLVVP